VAFRSLETTDPSGQSDVRLAACLGLIYLASEVLLTVARRSGKSADSTKDAGSLRFLWIVILVSISLAVNLSRRWQIAAIPHQHLFAALGVIIFVVGLILRWYSIIELGRFFTVNVAITEDHQLIKSGPYRWVRHPSYTGALLAFLGFGFSLGNWLALLVIMVPIFFAFAYRMKVEERALIGALGDRYASYAQRTKRLVPFIY
jgi:protein-S-isoprenylcysteine O-methyltransferase Ste14